MSERQQRVLMIAHVFPPFFSVGGSIRIVKFIKYLTAHGGWRPSVLTIDDSKEYDTQRKAGSESLLQDIPEDVTIHRTRAGEPSVELLERGRSLRKRSRIAAPIITLLSRLRGWLKHILLLPDENITWLPFAVRAGFKIIRSEGSDLIFVTCPPHSAALVGVLLKWLTRRPLVVDFRDDWVDTPWFKQKSRFAQLVERWQEWLVVHTANRMILVTSWSQAAFRQRYPRVNPDRFTFIPNGCDLQDFDTAQKSAPRQDEKTLTIVHAGLLTASDDWKRSPEGFFDALCRLHDTRPELWSCLRVVFTGKLPDEYRDMAAQRGLSGHVEEAGFLPWDDLLALMASADLLLTINYEGFATLIPGKIYEYWAVGGAPILLLGDDGAAGQLIETHGIGMRADPYDVDAIEAALRKVYDHKRRSQPIRISKDGIHRYDRAYLAGELRQLLDATTSANSRHHEVSYG